MNWAQFKDPVSHMCLAGAVVAFYSLTQEVVGSSTFLDKYFQRIKKNLIDITADVFGAEAIWC